MRLLRAWLPALLAATLWLASGAVEWLSRRTSSVLLDVLDLVAPETVPVDHLSAPGSWPVVLAGLSALAVVGGYAAALALVRVRRREAPAATTLAAYWMCAVVAGAVTAAVPFVAAVVEALAEGRMPSGLAGTYLVTGAHWGLLWGWLPALLARALDTDDAASARSRAEDVAGRSRAVRPGRSRAARPGAARSRAGVAVAGLLVLLVSGVGTAVATPAAEAARAAAVSTAPTPEP